MNKKVITIWANKNNNHDWLESASRSDCREKSGFTKVGFIGYNIKQNGQFTSFDSDNAWGSTNNTQILTINIDNIKDI